MTASTFVLASYIVSLLAAASDAEMAFLLVAITLCLGAGFVAAFCQFEQARIRWRDRNRDQIRLAHRPLHRRQDGRGAPKDRRDD
jgi:hypothetical protein